MRRLGDGILKLSEALAVGVLAIMILHLAVTIIFRAVFGVALAGTTELVADLYMPLAVFLALGISYRKSEEIRVDLIAARLPPMLSRFHDRFCQLVVACCALALAWYTQQLAARAIAIGERVEIGHHAIPTWPAQVAVCAGFAMMALAAILRGFSGDGK